jgi:AraC-like DNA-binding protein
MFSSPSSIPVSDPLSNVLGLLNLSHVRCTRLEAGNAWSLSLPSRERLKFVAVLRGTAWILVPDRDPCLLGTGDTLLLTNTPYVVTSDPTLAPQDGIALFGESNILRLDGDETIMLGGAFTFSDVNAPRMIEALPAFMHIGAVSPAAAVLRDTLKLLSFELEYPDMGSTLMTERLGDILLVQALRAYVAEYGAEATGWIGAFADARIGPAIKLMHDAIDHPWTVGELAAAVAMSRSAFALRFKSMVGVAPLEYLRRWRMQLAQHALHRGASSVATLATTLGYASVSAFGNAYKRTYGKSPKRAT